MVMELCAWICPIYSDRLHSIYATSSDAKVFATFRAGARGLDLTPQGNAAQVEIVPVEIGADQIRARLLEVVPSDPTTVDIVEAERIVAVGLGLPHPLGVGLAQELAESLGAAVGATRP